MTKLQAETVMALAENGLNITRAAQSLYCHRNTVVFHVKKIKESTGKDPQDFYDMIELVQEAKRVLGFDQGGVIPHGRN